MKPDPNIDTREWESLMTEISRFAASHDMGAMDAVHTLAVLGDVAVGVESDYRGIPEKSLSTGYLPTLTDVEKIFQNSCVRGDLTLSGRSKLRVAPIGFFDGDNLLTIKNKSKAVLVQIVHRSGDREMNTFALFAPDGKPKMRGLIIV